MSGITIDQIKKLNADLIEADATENDALIERAERNLNDKANEIAQLSIEQTETLTQLKAELHIAETALSVLARNGISDDIASEALRMIEALRGK